MLVDGKLTVCNACKTGEFRQNIGRCLTLRMRPGIGREHFIMGISGLNDEHAKGLTAMYDPTLTKEQELPAPLDRIS